MTPEMWPLKRAILTNVEYCISTLLFPLEHVNITKVKENVMINYYDAIHHKRNSAFLFTNLNKAFDNVSLIKFLLNRFTISTSVSRAVTIAGAAGAMHRGPSMRELRIATFYCKIFLLKAQVNLLLLNVSLHQ